eukprot:TRINITY_DN31883_c0_g1_i1.p1 TRINITY_DN31883_c0_g1~~TRINITY_DN31883_c0_g1_i1.p1  ORF type:complete len:170 (-),score=44.15 TRINITY_DN31883_c0_g1_i1:3-473(-)
MGTAQYENISNQYEQLKIQRQQDMEEKAFAENNSEKLEQSAKSMEKQMNHMKIVQQRKEQQLQDALNDKNNELTSLEYEFGKLKENYEEVAKTLNRVENQMQKLEIEKRNNLESISTVSYTHLRAHETGRNLVCRLLLEKKKNQQSQQPTTQREKQ